MQGRKHQNFNIKLPQLKISTEMPNFYPAELEFF